MEIALLPLATVSTHAYARQEIVPETQGRLWRSMWEWKRRLWSWWWWWCTETRLGQRGKINSLSGGAGRRIADRKIFETNTRTSGQCTSSKEEEKKGEEAAAAGKNFIWKLQTP